MIELGTEIRWQDRRFTPPMERILLSEKLGYDAVFTAEGWGSECFTPLGFVAGHTRHLKLGTRVARLTARSPLTTAMTFQTLDHMAGGDRIIAGLGNGDRLTAERTDGVSWGGRPAVRMRDYVAILRQAFAGETVDYAGKELSLPYRGPDAYTGPTGGGAEPRSIGLEPLSDVPIMLAASYPRTIAQTAEIADGWMPANFSPGMLNTFKPLLEEGFARAGGGKGLHNFKIWAHVDVNVSDDVRTAMRPFKEYVVTWSQRQRTFLESRGYTGLAERLREIVAPKAEDISPPAFAVLAQDPEVRRSPRWQAALDAVPDEFIDEGNWLAGPLERIRERIRPWFDSGVTGLVIRYGDQFTHEPMVENLDVFRVIAEAAGKAPRV
jgi:alkanesulfonate monooxygenase SsuD/methylene tetrahydromethanopterin reductase-like flavin-dependent oxidoreductase (luciferase family)